MTAKLFKAHLKNRELPAYCRSIDKDCPLDRWVSYAVKVLRDAGIETFESCQSGPGHSYLEPTVRFHGVYGDGFRALGVARVYGLPVRALRRLWSLNDGEPVGPYWELTFWKPRLIRLQLEVERTGRIK